MLLNNVAAALEEARVAVTVLQGELSELRFQRRKVEALPPHTSDIIGAFLRGLEKAEAMFIRQLTWSMTEEKLTGPDAATTVQNHGAQLLTPYNHRPGWKPTLPPNEITMDNPVGIPALSYLLGDKIREEIPKLVDRICPVARDGTKYEDRVKMLAVIDADIADRTAKLEAIQEQLNTAMQIAGGA